MSVTPARKQGPILNSAIGSATTLHTMAVGPTSGTGEGRLPSRRMHMYADGPSLGDLCNNGIYILQCRVAQ